MVIGVENDVFICRKIQGLSQKVFIRQMAFSGGKFTKSRRKG